MDDIVLGYIVEVLSNLGEEDSSFDVDQFSEMIAAYVPEFAEVDRYVGYPVFGIIIRIITYHNQYGRLSGCTVVPDFIHTINTMFMLYVLCSLVPRPRPAFHRLQYRAWERGFVLCILITMLK